MPKIGVTSLLRNAYGIIQITSQFLRQKLTFLSKTKPPDSEPFIEGLGLGARFLEYPIPESESYPSRSENPFPL